MTTTSLADVKNRLSELVASAETTHERPRIKADLLASPDAAARERAALYA